MRVRWSDPALGDLEKILVYIAEENPAAASKIAGVIRQAAQKLAPFPRVGKKGRLAGTREWVVQGTPYILSYAIERNEVLITGVVHGAREWKDGKGPPRG